MKSISILSLSFLLLLLCSCRKEKVGASVRMSFNDTCSYRVDGKVYTCNNLGGSYRTSLTNTNPRNGTGTIDSILYSTQFTLHIAEGGLFTINFIKKYGKNQFAEGAFLPNSPFFTTRFVLPDRDKNMRFYELGERKYAVDYMLTNNQNGAAISIDFGAEGYGSYLYYYPDAYYLTSQPNWDIQNNSYFEILKYYSLPTGGHALEAKFSVNVVNWKGQQQRIENGHILIHVN